MTLSIIKIKCVTQLKDGWHSILSDIILGVVNKTILQRVVMPSVVMLLVVMLSVVAPHRYGVELDATTFGIMAGFHYVESHCAKCRGANTTKSVLKRPSLQDGLEGDEATGQREMALNEPHFALVPSEKKKVMV